MDLRTSTGTSGASGTASGTARGTASGTASGTAAGARVPLDLDDVRARLTAAALVETASPGRVGLEQEWHVVDLADPLRSPPWEAIRAALGDLRPLPGASRVTLEPGGQVELSGPPLSSATAAVDALRADAHAVRTTLRAHGLGLVAVGADPARPPVHRHDGSRYAAMARAFAAAGCAGPARTMMCSTASLQLNLDAGPRASWDERIAAAHALGPVLTTISACSPWLHGVETGWASARMRAWQQLDPARTAPYPGSSEPAEAWATFALATPVLCLATPRGCIPVEEPDRVPMVDWISGRRQLGGRAPTEADLALHLTMLWPPLRLRGFLEVRSLDAVPDRWLPGLTGLAAALLDGDLAAEVLAACAPVARRWEAAARDGLRDPALRRVVDDVVGRALPRVEPGLRDAAEEYADLLVSGRTPGDLLRAAIDDVGPAAAFAALAHEAPA